MEHGNDTAVEHPRANNLVVEHLVGLVFAATLEMQETPIKVWVAERPPHGEPKTGLSGEDTREKNASHDSSLPLPLPPLAVESSAFRRTVWAHMDPYKRKRLNLEDFEDRLNIPPLQTTDNVSTLARSLWERLCGYTRATQ